MNLALFDFDGTLTTKDSLADFLKFAVDKKTYIKNMIIFSPIFILYKLKIIRNDIAKEKLFSQFFTNFNEEKFKEIAVQYSKQKLDLMLRDEIYNKFLTHIKNQDKVVIISASMKCWLQPWTDKHGVELLSTQLEFKNGLCTGKFHTPNCYGQEKLNRLNQHLDINNFEKIYAYGDSAGDEAILKIADFSYKI